ncbi:hypothetical protein [Chryseobacterium taichungense]|uniref:hypothetical protein n=1 Tax=Chryseobacterium taichungense TaxID=295069 RepID=UPI0028ACC249|nr:hypothetical protein [Chryseobacterium taichungense]
MSKTKFIKVSIDERLPDLSGTYITFSSIGLKMQNLFRNGKFEGYIEPKSWLAEVPDREEEMREMLEKARTVIARMKRSMLVHPDHEEGSEFDDQTTSAQEMENEIGEYLLNK